MFLLLNNYPCQAKLVCTASEASSASKVILRLCNCLLWKWITLQHPQRKRTIALCDKMLRRRKKQIWCIYLTCSKKNISNSYFEHYFWRFWIFLLISDMGNDVKILGLRKRLGKKKSHNCPFPLRVLSNGREIFFGVGHCSKPAVFSNFLWFLINFHL